YSFTAHCDLFRSTHPRPAGDAALSTGAAVALLAVATVLTTIQAEILVRGIGPALARFGFTELFAGVVVIALIGNAAEHYSAVAAARRDQMTLAVEIAAITVSVLATAMVVVDGESNWVEGLLLLSVYLILTIAFYLMPAMP